MIRKRIPIIGFISRSDLNTANEATSRLALFERDLATGALRPVTLGVNDFVEIESLNTMYTTAVSGTLYDGPDNTVDVGEAILTHRGTATMLTQTSNLLTPWRCLNGSYPKFKTSGASAAEVIIYGFWNKVIT